MNGLSVIDQLQGNEVLRAGALEIRPAEGLVQAGGNPLVLSVRELELLTALARRQGRIASRTELYEEVWGRQLVPGDRSIDVYVGKLRAKLARVLPHWRFIHTHFGFGYRFSPETSQAIHKDYTRP